MQPVFRAMELTARTAVRVAGVRTDPSGTEQ